MDHMTRLLVAAGAALIAGPAASAYAAGDGVTGPKSTGSARITARIAPRTGIVDVQTASTPTGWTATADACVDAGTGGYRLTALGSGPDGRLAAGDTAYSVQWRDGSGRTVRLPAGRTTPVLSAGAADACGNGVPNARLRIFVPAGGDTDAGPETLTLLIEPL